MSSSQVFWSPARVSWRRGAAALALVAGTLSPVHAGGPFAVSSSGEPFRWDASKPVQYEVDRGPLGSRSHDTAVQFVNAAIDAWQKLPTARLEIQAAGELPRDITGRNVVEFLNGLRADSPSPVLFDSDGSITGELLGEGADSYGFSALWIRSRERPHILVAYVVLSGPAHEDVRDPFLYSTAVHELGHMLGLDHSQLNAELQYDGDATNDHLTPVMSYSRGPNDTGSLHRDDVSWFSWLYPSADFAASTGTIRGQVLLPDGVTGLQGVNVIARRVGDPQVTAVSVVSGYLFGGDNEGVRDPGRLGEFLIPGLPPGTYILELLELNADPVVRVPPAYLVGGPKFYREGSSAQDPPTDSTPIVMNAGQEVKGIDVIVNGRSLGEPQPVTEQEPNELPEAQAVTLPAVISGAVEDSAGAGAGPPIDSETELHDVYQVTLREPTIVTAILSAEQSGVDLDLYVYERYEGEWYPIAAATDRGTPPETIQLYLLPGRYDFGVYRAGVRGSAYTLRLLATPAPDPEIALQIAEISYLVLGDVMPSSAAVRWQTTAPAPSVIWYNRPLREIGSTTRGREHALALTELAPGSRTEVTVFSLAGRSYLELDQVVVPLAAATTPAPDGEPRLSANSRATRLDIDRAEVLVRLSNPGDGDALQVRIEQVTPASGWEVLPDAPMPPTLEVGGIGAGGAGALLVRIARRSGRAEPRVTVHGSYTNAAGTPLTF
jgi:hypothetical protein